MTNEILLSQRVKQFWKINAKKNVFSYKVDYSINIKYGERVHISNKYWNINSHVKNNSSILR